MRAIRKQDTKPEMRVRRRFHAFGFRFRLNRRNLPGTPDIVLPGYRAEIQVHGCFSHQLLGCRHATKPRNRQDYWQCKLERNASRDRATAEATR
jgi:DNA mismatch endonuclease (patch repair protein)